MQEIEIWSNEQVVSAQPGICPGEWDAPNFLGLCDKNISPNLGLTTRPSYSQQEKKRTCRILDFAFWADHGVKIKEIENIVKFLDLSDNLSTKESYSNFRSSLLRCGKRPNEWITQWDTNESYIYTWLNVGKEKNWYWIVTVTMEYLDLIKWAQAHVKCYQQNIFTNQIYWIYMYKHDLALNNLQGLIKHKPNSSTSNLIIYTQFSLSSG